MGSTISALKKSLEDPEQEKQANDALNVLTQVAQTRIDTFYQRVNSPQFDPGLVPISKVIYKYQYFQCGVSNNASDVSKAISDSLGAFISGDVQKGVNTIVGSALGYLLGNYSANASSTSIYALTTGELGGLCRIDADFYSYEYTSKSLTSITKNVVVCSLVISSAKLDNLTLNDINGIVQTLYGGVDIGTQRRIRDQLWEQVQGNNHLLEYRSPLETANLGAIFKGDQDYDPNDIDIAVPQPGLDKYNTHNFPTSNLQLIVTRYPVNDESARRGHGEGKVFAESLKSFLTAWLVAYSRTLNRKEKCPDVSITYQCDIERDSQVFFDIRVLNVEEDGGRVLDLVQHEAEEGLRYLHQHPNVEPIASKFDSWRFERPVFGQRRGESDRFGVKGGLPFNKDTVNAVLSILRIDNPLLCGEQLTQLVIESADAFENPGQNMAKLKAFANAFAENFNDPDRHTRQWFEALYTVLRLVIAGINYYGVNRVQFRSDSLSQYWPWAAPNKMRESSTVLVNLAMPMPYAMKENLRGDGMVYMIGMLYLDQILSKRTLTGNYPDLYDFIAQYATNGADPDCRGLAIGLRDGPLDS